MPFNILKDFRRQRVVRAGVGILVLAGAAFAQYKLANFPLPVDVETIENFSPATVKLGQQELVIEGPVVNAEEGMLFSHDGKPNEIVEVSLDPATLHEQTIAMFEGVGRRPPSTPTRIDYRADESKNPAKGDESCRTRVELFVTSQMPSEIRFFQLGTPGQAHYRNLEITTKGAELIANLQTASPHDSDRAPGCQKLLSVGDWNISLTTIAVSTVLAENSTLNFNFRPLTTDSVLWGDAAGFFEPFDLGSPQLKPTDPPPFQARAVSVRPLGTGDSTHTPLPVISARSTNDGPLLTIYGLKIGSDQIQLNIAGKGRVQVNGHDRTVDFIKRVGENPLPSALLAAVNTALLAWVARLIFKRHSTSPQPKNSKGQSRKFQHRRKAKAKR